MRRHRPRQLPFDSPRDMLLTALAAALSAGHARRRRGVAASRPNVTQPAPSRSRLHPLSGRSTAAEVRLRPWELIGRSIILERCSKEIEESKAYGAAEAGYDASERGRPSSDERGTATYAGGGHVDHRDSHPAHCRRRRDRRARPDAAGGSGPTIVGHSKLGGTNISALGAFAGFSLTSAIFIAGLDVARSSSAFATVFGMMLTAFLILVIAAWVTGSTPSVPQAEETPVQSLALVLGNLCANLGVSITWLALAPLMVVIGLPALADVFIWALLIMALAAGGWIALFTCRLTMASARRALPYPCLG